MLRSFRVANHKSIKDEQELLLMPAYSKDRPVVPVTAIFGANASGKSNLLDALAWMQTAVRGSFASWEPGTGVPRHAFRLVPESANEPSLFVVELLLDGFRWTYGFTVDDEQVTAEWLFTYPHSRKRIVFQRDGAKWTFGTGVPQSEAAVLRSLTRDNALFLSVASRSDFEPTAAVYKWFQRNLRFSGRGPRLVDRVTRRLESAEPERLRFIELVRAADFGIADIKIEQLEPESDPRDLRRLAQADVYLAETQRRLDDLRARRAKRQEGGMGSDIRMLDEEIAIVEHAVARAHEMTAAMRKLPHRPPTRELVFLQGAHGVPLKMAEQSAGTRAWLALLDDGLTALENGSVLCIDEVDTSLHPRLTARLIELFRDETTNAKGAQLVFTTHDATLLGTSFGSEILGRDEVWFVEKDAEGRTALFPLSDFHPRKDENTERRYLGGSYGAVPAVFSNSLVDRLQRLQRSTDAAA